MSCSVLGYWVPPKRIFVPSFGAVSIGCQSVISAPRQERRGLARERSRRHTRCPACRYSPVPGLATFVASSPLVRRACAIRLLSACRRARGSSRHLSADGAARPIAFINLLACHIEYSAFVHIIGPSQRPLGALGAFHGSIAA